MSPVCDVTVAVKVGDVPTRYRYELDSELSAAQVVPLLMVCVYTVELVAACVASLLYVAKIERLPPVSSVKGW